MRNIIVIGASAGGVEAVGNLVSLVPPGIPASIFVVVHVPSWRPSELPAVLAYRSKLPAMHPRDGEPIVPGAIYVAPPDRHLLVEENEMRLWRGPKENRQRPAINVLFRSAAVAHGSRVIGIVLTGALDDGTTGLWWVKRFGGTAIVQDPKEAQFPEMPCSALAHVAVDYTLRVDLIASALMQLTNGASAGAKEVEENHR